MKNLLLILGIAIVVVVAVVLALVVYLATQLDRIAAGAIEHIGSNALGVDVSVKAVDLRMSEGKGTIKGLEIANPPGYSRSPMFSMDKLTLKLGAEHGHVRLLSVEAPEIRVEVKGEANNIDDLLAGLGSNSPPSTESEVTNHAGEPLKLRIDRIEIESARAVVIDDNGDEKTLQVDALVFTDLEGTGEQIADEILNQLLTEVKRAVAGAVGASVQEAVQEKASDLGDRVEDAVRGKLGGD